MKAIQIAKDYNLHVVNITKKNLKKNAEKYDIDKKDLRNNAYLVENEDVVLGIYDDKEEKMAAFFHEVGHAKVSKAFENLVDDVEMLIEVQAWVEGLKIAKKYNYKFSRKAYKYILNSVNSYYKCSVAACNKRKEK